MARTATAPAAPTAVEPEYVFTETEDLPTVNRTAAPNPFAAQVAKLAETIDPATGKACKAIVFRVPEDKAKNVLRTLRKAGGDRVTVRADQQPVGGGEVSIRFTTVTKITRKPKPAVETPTPEVAPVG